MMGDILPYIAASFMGQPLLIIELSFGSPYCTFADPKLACFGQQETINWPCVVVRQKDHFEDLIVGESQRELVRAIYTNLKNGAAVILRPENRGWEAENLTFDPILTSTPFKTSQKLNKHNTESLQRNMDDGRDDSREREKEQYQYNLSILQAVSRRKLNPSDGSLSQLCSDSHAQTQILNESVSNQRSRCHVCGFMAATPHTGYANHLRESKCCLEEHRKDEEFNIRGSDEQFIVKVSLLIKECPAPNCGGESHWERVPVECLQWWGNIGKTHMGWRVAERELDSKEVKRKTSVFLRNYRKRHAYASQRSYREEDLQKEGPDLHNYVDDQCICGFMGPLVVHLNKSHHCVALMKRMNFVSTKYNDEEHLRQTIYDVGLLLKFCPNPECSSPGVGQGPIEHLNGPCLPFLVREAAAVFGWNLEGTKEELKGKHHLLYMGQTPG